MEYLALVIWIIGWKFYSSAVTYENDWAAVICSVINDLIWVGVSLLIWFN